MSPWLIAILSGIVVAIVQYGARDLRSGPNIASALLRIGAVALVVALILDAAASPSKPVPVWAALDVSVSMMRGDSTLWHAARDSVRAARPDSVLFFGDSARHSDSTSLPRDLSTQLRPAVERALGAGHPLVVVTDGELDDPDAARALPNGSRLIVLPHPAIRDVAVSAMDVPRAVVAGDSIEAHVTVAAGGAGARKVTLTLSLDGKPIATAPIDTLGAYAERVIPMKVRLEGSAGPAVLRAFVTAADDRERRNDTVAVAIDLSRAATAVFVSTSPDFDARYALAVLRGGLSIPTRGFFRVAPGEWRVDGALTPVSQEDVRTALREAPVAIIHGDTAAFGPPRTVTIGPLALIVTTGTEGEWYPSAAPASPISAAMSGVVWDSLPPVGVSQTIPQGTWQGVEARRGRGEERKPIVVGTDEPRRVAIIGASGLWRWRFRGGAASDAFTALWGSIFDWLAAERADRRAAVPDERLLRAGDPVRWRRGSPTDTVVNVALRRRGATRVDSLTLHFPSNATVVESKPLAPGIYDATVRGGNAVVVVNESREWLPRAPRVASGGVHGSVAADTAPRLRDKGWPYALVILMLCAEWILRRRRGMR
jgi:hypothetical protein